MEGGIVGLTPGVGCGKPGIGAGGIVTGGACTGKMGETGIGAGVVGSGGVCGGCWARPTRAASSVRRQAQAGTAQRSGTGENQ